jgi:general secretion pathway protein A
LTDEESRDYILYRLAKVAMMDEPIFTRGALREIIQYAKGTPRVINVLCTNALIQGYGYGQRRIPTQIIKEVIADYTGKKPRRLWRSWMAVVGITALLAALSWFSPYQEIALSKINLAKVRQFMTPSVVSRMSPPQETPAAVRDSLLSVPSSTPAFPEHHPQPVVSPTTPETAEPAPTVSVTMRTVKRGDLVGRVALDVYGAANSTVLEWIRKNNPQLRDLNRVEAGTQLTLPPLPANIR